MKLLPHERGLETNRIGERGQRVDEQNDLHLGEQREARQRERLLAELQPDLDK